MPRRGNPMYAKYMRWVERISRKPTCPVCRLPGSGLYIKKVKSHGRIYKYRYFAHWEKGKVRWCYMKHSRVKDDT